MYRREKFHFVVAMHCWPRRLLQQVCIECAVSQKRNRGWLNDWMIEKKTDLHGELETDANIEAKSRTFFVSLFSLIMFILCMDMWSQWHSVLIQCSLIQRPFRASRSELDVRWPVQYLTDLSDTNCWQCIYRAVWSQRAPDHLWIKTIWSAYTIGHVQYPIWPHLSLKSLWRHYLRYKSNQDLWEHG